MLVVTIIAWAILVSCPLLGFRLGSSTMFLVALFTLLSGLLASASASLFSLIFASIADQAFAQLILLFVLLVLSIPLAIYLNRYFAFSMEPFEWIIGSLAGIATGFMATFFILSLLLSAATLPASKIALEESFVVRQFVHFEAWHKMEHSLFGFTESIAPETEVK